MRQHLEDPVPPPGTINPALAFADEPLLAALSKSPEGRPALATDVSEALDRGYESWRPASVSAPFASVDPDDEAATAVMPVPRAEPTPAAELRPPPPTTSGGSKRRWNRTAIFAAVGAAFVAAGIAVGVALLLGGGDDNGATPAGETATQEASATGTGEATPGETAQPSTSPTPETRDISGDVIVSESFDDPASSSIQPPTAFSASGFFDSGRLIVQDASADDDRYAPIGISTGATTHAVALDAFAPGGVLIFTCRGNERFEVRLRVRQDSQEFQTQVLDKQQPGFVTLTDWTKSDAIKAAEPNRFAMICHGNEVASVANRQVLSKDRIPGIEGDQVSFGVDGGVQGAFDNVEVRTN
jgi:hypothetical protein